MGNNAEIMRGRVNGVNKYCRIPIRRKRTPMYAEELEGVLYRFMSADGVDREGIRQEANKLFENGDYENSGLMISALDFMDLFERIAFRD